MEVAVVLMVITYQSAVGRRAVVMARQCMATSLWAAASGQHRIEYAHGSLAPWQQRCRDVGKHAEASLPGLLLASSAPVARGDGPGLAYPAARARAMSVAPTARLMQVAGDSSLVVRRQGGKPPGERGTIEAAVPTSHPAAHDRRRRHEHNEGVEVSTRRWCDAWRRRMKPQSGGFAGRGAMLWQARKRPRKFRNQCLPAFVLSPDNLQRSQTRMPAGPEQRDAGSSAAQRIAVTDLTNIGAAFSAIRQLGGCSAERGAERMHENRQRAVARGRAWLDRRRVQAVRVSGTELRPS